MNGAVSHIDLKQLKLEFLRAAAPYHNAIEVLGETLEQLIEVLKNIK
jgi:hypothetical protein